MRANPHRLLIACASALLLFAMAAGFAGAASSTVTITATVPSSVTFTNGCTTPAGYQIGTILPGASKSTATGAGVCRFDFSSSNDSAQIRLGQRDALGEGMGQPGGPGSWSVAHDGRSVNDIDMYNASFGMASTDAGVMCTLDGGTTWYSYANGFGGLGDVEHVPGDPQTWLVVGNSDVLRFTNVQTNCATGTGMTTPTSYAAQLGTSGWPAWTWINGIDVVNATTWLVVGTGGRVSRTTNTGGTWGTFQIPAVQWTNLTGVDQADAAGTTFYAVAEDGSVLKATGGGAAAGNWTVGASIFLDARSIDVTGTGGRIYIGAGEGTVWAGTDGAGWAASFITAQAGARGVNKISAVPGTPSTAFAAAEVGEIYVTTDGGVTWTLTDSNVGSRVFAVDAVSTTTAMAGGVGRTLQRTVDGANWNVVSEQAGWMAYTDAAADPVNGQVVVGVAGRGRIRRTADSGTTWTSPASGTTEPLFGVAMSDGGVGWAVGDDGVILQTRDRGLTWTAQTSGTTVRLLDVAAVSDLLAYAVGDGGTILKTTNGQTWSPVASGTTRTLMAVTAPSAAKVIVAGMPGAGNVTIAHSANGGTTWTPAAALPTVGGPVRRVVGVSDTRAYALANGGNGAWTTTDGGVTWTDAPNWTRNDVIAAAGDALLEAGSWGQMWVSRDGRVTSTDDRPAVGYLLHTAGVVVDGHRVYAFTEGGGIATTTPSAAAGKTVTDYGGANTWGNAGNVNLFGVCVQDVGLAATVAAPWVEDTVTTPGVCGTTDSDPWAAVPATPTKVAQTSGAGVNGRLDLVWGMRTRSDQSAGTYRATVVIEALAPAI